MQWLLRPTSELPACRASDWIELWVRGGELEVNGERAYANCFVVVEPGASLTLKSSFGACVLAWAEGRESWPEGDGSANLFGF